MQQLPPKSGLLYTKLVEWLSLYIRHARALLALLCLLLSEGSRDVCRERRLLLNFVVFFSASRNSFASHCPSQLTETRLDSARLE